MFARRRYHITKRRIKRTSAIICLIYVNGMLKFREINESFPEIWRVFISGSSSAGKTHFAKQLLQANFFKFERIYYYHPDIQEDFPVDWSSEFDKPVLCQAGLPTNDDLHDIPPFSVLVLDDLFTEACKDKLMSYLFRVLSSKKKLHVIIMTQRYFAEGSCGLNIRNSSNFHVLMNNADERTNMRVAFSMNLASDIRKAIVVNKKKLYPYIMIDRTNIARVNGVQIYTDIFSKYKQVIFNSMPSYLISESDFKSKFQILDKTTAIRNGQHTQKRIYSKYNETESSSSEESSSDEDWRSRKEYERNLPKYSINSKLQRKN